MGGRHWSEISFFLFFLFKGVIPWASDVLSQRLYFKEKNRNNNTFTPWVVKWKNDETFSPDSWLGIVPFFFFFNLLLIYLFYYFNFFKFVNVLLSHEQPGPSGGGLSRAAPRPGHLRWSLPFSRHRLPVG